MTKNAFLSTDLSPREITWGLRYLLFQTLFLPSLLNMINWLLPNPMSSVQLNFLFFSINIAAVVVIFKNYLLQFLDIGDKDILKIAGIALGGFAVYQVSTFALGLLLSYLAPELTNANDQSIIALSESNYALTFIGTVLLAPIAEEVLHRGLVFRGLYRKSPVIAYAVSTAVFAAIHILGYTGQPLALALTFLQYVPAGLCFAASYRLSGSIFCPIVIHMAVNAMGMLSLR